MRIALVGGTGKEGVGLGARWARAGHHVIIGSRDEQKAKAAAEAAGDVKPGVITGEQSVAAAAQGEVVVLAVPYSAHADVLKAIKPGLAGKVLVDITVPIKPPKVSQVNLPEGQAAALESQAIVGPETPVVATLHHVSSVHLGDVEHPIDCDVLYCSDDARAKETAASLIRDLGLFPVDAGALRNAIALESLTPVLLHINRTYKVAGAGLRITGLPRSPA